MSATMTAVPPRTEVPVEETWALETVFATDDAWEEAFEGSGERLRAVEAIPGPGRGRPERRSWPRCGRPTT